MQSYSKETLHLYCNPRNNFCLGYSTQAKILGWVEENRATTILGDLLKYSAERMIPLFKSPILWKWYKKNGELLQTTNRKGACKCGAADFLMPVSPPPEWISVCFQLNISTFFSMRFLLQQQISIKKTNSVLYMYLCTWLHKYQQPTWTDVLKKNSPQTVNQPKVIWRGRNVLLNDHSVSFIFIQPYNTSLPNVWAHHTVDTYQHEGSVKLLMNIYEERSNFLATVSYQKKVLS